MTFLLTLSSSNESSERESHLSAFLTNLTPPNKQSFKVKLDKNLNHIKRLESFCL